jgi:hypothetical protein
MSTDYHPVRIETLLALSLSKRWPRNDVALESGDEETAEEKPAENGLAFVLRGLNPRDRDAAEALLKRFLKLSPGDQSRWLGSRLSRIRASTPERNRRFDKDIHPSQIVEALRAEPSRIQSLVIGLLPPSVAEPVADELGLSLPENVHTSLPEPNATKLAGVVRRAFFSQFVFTTALNNPTPLDLLSGVELARLIRLLGVRETAIACRGIAAVETVTAFLKQFSAEDAQAIAFHLGTLKPLKPERIAFAETIARKAINEESSVASPMLDRVGLTLLAIVLGTFGTLRRRHTAQKLPVPAARELEDLINLSRTYCDREMAHRIVAEAQSLADNLHRFSSEPGDERRGAPAV